MILLPTLFDFNLLKNHPHKFEILVGLAHFENQNSTDFYILFNPANDSIELSVTKNGQPRKLDFIPANFTRLESIACELLDRELYNQIQSNGNADIAYDTKGEVLSEVIRLRLSISLLTDKRTLIACRFIGYKEFDFTEQFYDQFHYLKKHLEKILPQKEDKNQGKIKI